jgi:hypothetical protein
VGQVAVNPLGDALGHAFFELPGVVHGGYRIFQLTDPLFQGFELPGDRAGGLDSSGLCHFEHHESTTARKRKDRTERP